MEQIQGNYRRLVLSIRDLIHVWGLPHLNQVITNFKEIEFLMGI